MSQAARNSAYDLRVLEGSIHRPLAVQTAYYGRRDAMQDEFQISQERQRIAQIEHEWTCYGALIAGRDAARAGRSDVKPQWHAA